MNVAIYCASLLLRIQEFVAVWMVPIIAAFSLSNCPKSFRESNVVSAERHFTVAASNMKTWPPISTFLRLYSWEWHHFPITTARIASRSGGQKIRMDLIGTLRQLRCHLK